MPTGANEKHDNQCTAIVDSGASNIYLTPAAPMASIDGTAPKIQVGTAAGGLQKLSATCDLALPHLPADFPKTGYVMPEFHENLVGIGPMCDAGYTVQFTADAVIISNKDAVPVITGWRKKTGPRLWRMTLQPAPEYAPTLPPTDTTTY